MAKNATTEENRELPITTMAGNAKSLAEMQAQMEKMKHDMAKMTAEDVYGVLDRTIKNAESSTAVELPTPVSNYLTARMASALFMSLRDELVGAYMRVESIQKDKAVLNDRLTQGTFRSDVEKASAERSLSYYETLEERLEEIESLISDVIHVYHTAVQAQHDEDDQRQQDVPPADRTYVNVPSIRWVSNADKQADPDGWEKTNDMERLTKQAEFWLTYNS